MRTINYVLFETNVDEAQRLVQKINKQSWFQHNTNTPQVGDRVEVFNESRPDRIPNNRRAKMIVRSRRWEDGKLYIYLGLDEIWFKKSDMSARAYGNGICRDDAYTLFKRWVNWDLTEEELRRKSGH